VHERHSLLVRESLDGCSAVGREVRRVFVLPFDDAVEIDVREASRKSAVVTGDEPMLGGRKHFFRRHTAPKDTESAARIAVVYERQFDVGIVREQIRDSNSGAPVGTDDRDVCLHT
jgi:hypothetical protein